MKPHDNYQFINKYNTYGFILISIFILSNLCVKYTNGAAVSEYSFLLSFFKSICLI